MCTRFREDMAELRRNIIKSDGMDSVECWSDPPRDVVNSPSHYNKGEIETIDYIVDVLGVDGGINYCQGNVLKYTGTRLFEKGNPIQDAKKARWYLDKLISLVEGKQ